MQTDTMSFYIGFNCRRALPQHEPTSLAAAPGTYNFIWERGEGSMKRIVTSARLGVIVLATLLGLVLLAGVALAASTKITWYGQAAFKVETPSGGVILIDPWLSVPTNPDKSAIAKLERVDYILITHGHRDHVGDSVEIGKKTGAVLVTSYGLQFNMKSMLGYPEQQATVATGGNVGGAIDLSKAGAKVTLTTAVHNSELTPPNLPAPKAGEPGAVTSGNPIGFILEIDGGPTIYHTGDTDVFTDMKLIPDFFNVDLMLACIGGHFTMGPERAAQAVEWVQAKQVVPMHFGTFGLLAGTPAQLKEALDKRGLGNRVVEMKPGETREF
jgi:L-ascorbate metabolism protein UlaG (beta-lactamase superfamily)